MIKEKKNNSHLRPNLGGQQYKSCIRSTNKTLPCDQACACTWVIGSIKALIPLDYDDFDWKCW